MTLKIGKNDFRLYFGFDFISYINKEAGLSTHGVNLGMGGMQTLAFGIGNQSPMTLITIIKGATNTLNRKPTDYEIEQYIEELLGDEEKYLEVYSEVVEEMGKHLLLLREMGITKEEWNEALRQDEMEQKKTKKKQ